jgi:ribosomal protein S8E
MRKKEGGYAFFTNTINDIKQNENVLKPIYDTSANFGLLYNLMSALFSTFICIIMILVGFWIKDINIKKSETTSGIINSAECNIEKNKTTCMATVIYTVNNVKYTNQYTSQGIVNKGQRIEVYYNPLDPNDFTVENYTYYAGVGMIVLGIIIVISSWVWFLLSYIYKPVAAISGVGAMGNMMMPSFNYD